MSVKVVINAEGVRQLIKDNPEVEVDLAKNAAAQVAAVLKRDLNVQQIVDRAIDSINKQVATGYTMPKEVRDQIATTVDRAVSDRMRSLMTDTFEENLRSFFKERQNWLSDSAERRLDDLINRKVADILAAMRRF